MVFGGREKEDMGGEEEKGKEGIYLVVGDCLQFWDGFGLLLVFFSLEV